MKNILLTIEYDGTGFSGWQRQPGRRTVQGELERVLSVLCNEEVRIEGTSRTDAGVHAFGQRATLRGGFGIPTDRIPVAANHLLAGAGPFGVGDVRICRAQEMEEGFHARFNAVGKTYLYRIRCGFPPDIMERNYAYQLDAPLDVGLMKKAAGYMAGRHDFRSFMASGGQEMKSTVRTIYGLSITETSAKARPAGFGQEGKKVPLSARKKGQAREIEIRVTGDGFLYNMVRILTGTLVEAGMGKRAPEEVPEIIESLDRRLAGHTAPPQGLYLARVYYDVQEMLGASEGDGEGFAKSHGEEQEEENED